MIGLDFGGFGGGGFNILSSPLIRASAPQGSASNLGAIRVDPVKPTETSPVANWGGAVQGGASGAVAGTTVSPGWGTLIGGVIGAVAGLFGSKSKPAVTSPSNGSNAMPTESGGFSGALTSGLGSIPFVGSLFGGGGSSPAPVTQTQNVNQENTVNVQNILGKPFGVSPDGSLDSLQVLSDMIALKNANDSAIASVIPASSAPSAAAPAASSDKITPLIIVGAVGVGAYLLLKKKGK